MSLKKDSGILCHLTSLPTAYGVGDFGPVAYEFVDRLAIAQQTYWQILPIGNTDETGCPYSTDSAFGCAEYYVSPELLIKDYDLPPSEFSQYAIETKIVDFKQVTHNKKKILKIAFSHFSPNAEYTNFLKTEAAWIEDYCLFRALSETRGYKWRAWGELNLSPVEIDAVLFHKFCQFIAFSQLRSLKNYANSKNIKLVGDLPIFVSYNSMDVWKNPEQFYLNDNLEMEFETGAAPDGFSVTGQKWGTPIYNWEVQKKSHYQWWNTRLSFLKRYFDVIRIDHFRGFCATWISSVSEADASGGHWYPGPGADLFNQISDYPEIIAEDLGFITPDVDQLRDQFNFPGMKVFQFLLGDDRNPHKIKNYNYNSVAYSGTHDCDTLMGWFNSLSDREKANVETELNCKITDQWSMLEVLMNTKSRLVLIQIQDLLGLGSEARFNYPGTVQISNWTWKLSPSEFGQINWQKLGKLTVGRSVCG